jgi:phage-related protein
MNYTISFYNDTIEDDILQLPTTLLARYLNLTDRMLKVGANLGEPHTQAMGSGLFELRLKGAEGIARVFYCTLVGKRIVMLHSFIKKTQKTPANDLHLAINRMKEVKNANL